jgi:hypothetical protein
MLRLNLNDINETVLFVDPMNGVKILKQKDDSEETTYVLLIDTGDIVCYAEYNSEDVRDAVYGYVLNKINEYLFPQIEAAQLRCKEETC